MVFPCGYLAHRIETIRQNKVYGVRLKRLLPLVGELPLQHIHDGTLAPYVEACRKKGLKTKTITRSCGVCSIWRRGSGVTNMG